ncbi:hypothetical protein OSB04_012397 [Centaurea solstitialis]|uniref:Uncharacterized protein n=1 Tax=Centaurea solstitialis TaxID=347529 RepID=A0AA38TW15_9ASTR|nr:hypothetical protein OSB04_012397 [Centaurea solstitialis]
MQTQLRDYGNSLDKIPILCDSKSAIAISANRVQHSKTKHFDIRYHFLKHRVEEEGFLAINMLDLRGSIVVKRINPSAKLKNLQQTRLCLQILYDLSQRLCQNNLCKQRCNTYTPHGFQRFSKTLRPLQSNLFIYTESEPVRVFMDKGSVSGNRNSINEEVDQTQVSTLAAQFLSSGYDKVTLQLKSNNHYLAPKINGFPDYTDLMIQVFRNHHLSYALQATVPIHETYATQFLMSSYVCNHEEYVLCIVGYVLHPGKKTYATLHLNTDLLRSSLHLPDLEALALDTYDDVPSEDELLGFLRFLNYREDDKHPLQA